MTETISQNQVGGMDRIINIYNFPGELLTSIRTHSGHNQTTVIGTKYTYDHMGRKLRTVQYIDNPVDSVILSELAYNELGQLIEKKIHSADNGGTFLNTESYGYNPRGWLKQQNGPRFSMELKYEDGTTPRYNGNISNQYWGTSANPTLHNYTYLYDKLDRLTSGISDEGFNETIGYDKMGNITSLERNPMGTSIYSYSGNRLMGITGSVNSSYEYDANGNQTTDSGKGIVIGYNHLNLPQTISKASTSETMINSWLATGTKLRKTVGGMTRDYAGGIEYNDGQIEFIQTEEGRAIPLGSNGYSYEYMLKDHLGNTRVLLKEDGSTLETSDYYPFGLQVSRSGQTVTSPENRYKYNGKELQTELGLEQYDYGARFYDPVIGRWNVVDPFIERHYDFSPYNYVLNNPLSYIDPFGLDTLGFNELTPEEWHGFDIEEDVLAIEEVVINVNKNNTRNNSIVYTGFFMGGLQFKLGKTLDKYNRFDGIREYAPYRLKDLSRTNPALRTRPVNIELEIPFINKSLGRFVVPRNVVKGVANSLKAGGILTAGYSIFTSTNSFIDNKMSRAHFATNVFMTGVSFAWPIGTIISIGYSLVAEDMIFKE